MAHEPLDRRILREIRERLKESRAAVNEYHRLEAALEALDGAHHETGPRTAPRATAKPRAARGANRDKALKAIDARPGVTVAELASTTGIAKNTLYALTRTLTEQRLIERVALPGDTVGFRTVRRSDAASDAAGDGADVA